MSGLLQGARDRLDSLRKRINLAESYQSVFGTPDGQRVLAHIMRVAHCHESNFVQGDPHGTSFREGQRHLALSIARMVNRDTTELIKLIEQGLTDETNS